MQTHIRGGVASPTISNDGKDGKWVAFQASQLGQWPIAER